jgi:hypothetical protein
MNEKVRKVLSNVSIAARKKPTTNKDELAALAGCTVYFKVCTLLCFFLLWIKSGKPSLIFTINVIFGHTVNDDADG